MLRSADKRLALNETVSGEVFNQNFPEHFGSCRERILHPGSEEFGVANLLRGGIPIHTAAAWFGANKPMALPFRLRTGAVVYQLGWRNGTGTMTDSVDIGIYDTAWNRKVSKGGTARAGVGSVQWVDVTDTFLNARTTYYLAMSSNGITAANCYFMMIGTTVTFMGGVGVQDSTTNSYPLPDPLVGMGSAATLSNLPYMFIACRIPF